MVRDVFLVRDTATHLLVEDGLGLTTVTALLAVVATLPLREDGVLALLVLGDLVGPVLWSAKNLFKTQGVRTCASCRPCPCSLRAIVRYVPSYFQ